MHENFYKAEETLDELSKIGQPFVDWQSGVITLDPFVQIREIVTVLTPMYLETDLDDIPAEHQVRHELYFYNADAIHPVKDSVRCVAPGKLEKFSKVWIPIPYIPGWEDFEQMFEDMDNIRHPFTVLSYPTEYPRTMMLTPKEDMNLFKGLLEGNHRQVTIQEFERVWINLFYPGYHKDGETPPIDAWMHIAETPNAYVDVIERVSKNEHRILFTIPPLLSLNEDGVLQGKQGVTFEFSSLVKRVKDQNGVVPNSGEGELAQSLNSLIPEANTLTKHQQMWMAFFERYKMLKDTDGDNSVNKTTTQTSGSAYEYKDEVGDAIF